MSSFFHELPPVLETQMDLFATPMTVSRPAPPKEWNESASMLPPQRQGHWRLSHGAGSAMGSSKTMGGVTTSSLFAGATLGLVDAIVTFACTRPWPITWTATV